MQIDTQRFLDLVEQANSMAFVDIEGTGLRGDYNSILVVSVRPFQGAPTTFRVLRPGDDKTLVTQVLTELAKYDCWVTFFGKGYDMPMINTRALMHGLDPLDPRHHIDMYWVLKTHTLFSRRSQAHYLRALDVPEKKMDMSPEEWNNVLKDPDQYIPKMVRRCDSDTKGLKGLYRTTRHLIRDIKR